MYFENNNQYIYEFTPGWFSNIKVENITIKWKANKVLEANTENRENGYFVWNDHLNKNQKITAKVSYNSNAFKPADLTDNLMTGFNMDFSDNFDLKGIKVLIGLTFAITILGAIVSIFSPDDYSSHRGFYGSSYNNHHHHHSTFHHSSCVHTHSCACACACAGGGRAGCSKKDFYGTKLKTKDILKHL